MLTSIGVKSFKSYDTAELKLAPLTVLIGANASGKSNALEALRLLSWIAQGNRLSLIRYAVYEKKDQTVRGTVPNLSFRGRDGFSLSCGTDDADWNFLEVNLRLGEDDDLHIVDERITSPITTVPLYEVVSQSSGPSSDLRVAYNNFARGGKKPQVTCNDQIAILQQLQSAVRFESGHKGAQAKIPEICSRFQEILSKILFLDPQPSTMRGYSFKAEDQILGSGANLSGVLYNLCQDNQSGIDVLELIKSLPEQNISKISFIETPRGEVMLELEETFGGHLTTIDATLLSDGTLRVLSIAAAILSAPEGSLVVIEEIDNGVHPSRAKAILNTISAIAKRRSLRVLISSHNPALLDALPDDAVPNVVFCYREIRDGSSKLVRLQDVPDYPELIAQGSLGSLMTAGLIDRFVKFHPGKSERFEAARRWLQNLQESA